MIDKLRGFLPEEITNSYDLIQSLKRSKSEWRFVFLDNEEFKNKDTREAHSIYWKEMLTRIYLVVLVSFFKTMRWMDSLNNLIDNHYGFCASLRGLIESNCDAFYTLEKVPHTIAVDYCAIKKQINKESIILTNHKGLEDELSHFVLATKLKKDDKQKYPEWCNSRPVSEYLGSISKHDEGIKNLYDILCGITHPAYESTRIFLFHHKGETIVFNNSQEMEEKLNIDLVGLYKDSLRRMFNAYINNSISILLLLNKFSIPELHTTYKSDYDFEKSKTWEDIKRLMIDSQDKYFRALRTGYYE